MNFRVLHYSDLENVYDTPVRAGRVARVLRERRSDSTLVVGTGDNTAASILGRQTAGEQALDLYQAVDPDFETFGNHDFDFGTSRAREIVAASPQTWLTANVYEAAEPARFAVSHTEPSTVVEVGGLQVGLTGVTTPATESICPHGNALSINDPVEAANEAVADLRAAGADVVLVLSHLGDEESVRALDADIVCDGHTHTGTVEDLDGTVCVRPDSGGHHIAEVTVTLDGEGTVTASGTLVDVDTATPLSSLVEGLSERLRETGLDEVVATVEEPIRRTEAATSCGESRIGNLVTDAYRWAGDADAAVFPPAGFRTGEALEGDLRCLDLEGLSPFDRDGVVVEVSGAELRSVVRELSLVDEFPDAPTSTFGHVSGLSLEWDDAAEAVRGLRINGDPVDEERSYEVATRQYFIDREGLFPTLDSTLVVRSIDVGESPVVAYAREHDVSPEREGRIRRPTLNERPTGSIRG